MKIILSIRGGGVRGLIEGIVLTELERVLRIKLNNKKALLVDYVDLVCGSSTGGILTTILTALDKAGNHKYCCSDIVNFYKKEIYYIFNESERIMLLGGIYDANKYKIKHINKAFKRYFGNETLQSLSNHVLIATVDLNTCEPFFFSNVKHDKELETYKLCDVLRCTSAALTYFPQAVCNTKNNKKEIVGIDGGFVANDPAICAIAKELKYGKSDLENICVLDIGSGSIKPELGNVKKPWGIVKSAKNIPNIMMYSNIGMVEYELLYFNLGQLFLIDVPEEARKYNSDMADASDENITLLETAAYRTINKNKKNINNIVDFLIQNVTLEKN